MHLLQETERALFPTFICKPLDSASAVFRRAMIYQRMNAIYCSFSVSSMHKPFDCAVVLASSCESAMLALEGAAALSMSAIEVLLAR